MNFKQLYEQKLQANLSHILGSALVFSCSFATPLMAVESESGNVVSNAKGNSIAQQKTVTVRGVVKDQMGETLPGASVLEKGTTNGAITNVDGAFSLNVKPNSTLVISFMGYKPIEVKANGNRPLNIILEEDNATLDEVVVVAYGTAKKKDLTGSMTQVDTKAIQAQNTSTVTRALEGSAPGLQVSSVDGQPGVDMAIRIRGLSSANASSSVALIVIDGVPAQGDNPLSNLNSADIANVTVLKDAASTALYGSRGANGVVLITTKKGQSGKAKISFTGRWGWNYLGASNMSNMSEASQVYEFAWKSIYNSYRYGVNGTGKPGVDANGVSYTNVHNPNYTHEEAAEFASQHLFNYVNSETKFQVNKLGNWLAYDVPGATYVADQGTGTNKSATMMGAYLVNTDGKINPNARYLYTDEDTYADQLIKTAFRQEYNVSANGGNENTTYYASAGYLSDPSYVRASDFERFSGRASFDSKVLKWLKVGANVSYTKTTTNSMSTKWGRNAGSAVGNVLRYINGHSPIMSAWARDENWDYVYDADGNRVATGTTGSSYSPLGSTSKNYIGADIVYDIDNNINRTNIDLWSSRLYAEITFLKDFKFTVNFSLDQQDKRLMRYSSKLTSAGSKRGGISIAKTDITMINTQQLLSYNKNIGKHHFDAMIGHEYDDYDYEYLSWGSADELIPGYISPGNFTSHYSNVNNYSTPSWSLDVKRMESYLGRVNYNYNEKYYLSGSLRGDGSSKFMINKWGVFGSVGGGWRFSSEEFMSDTKDWLDNAKLRLSYGVIGNQNGIGNYTNHTWTYGSATWSTVSNGTGVASSYSIGYGSLVNEELTWENTHTTDLGLDFSIFKGRLSGTLDFYNNLTTNSFFNQKVSILANAGQETRQRNSAKLRNRGFELELSADVIRTKDFTWNVSLNGTHYKTILVDVPDDQIPAWNETSDLPQGCWTSGTDAWTAAGVSSDNYTFYLRGEGRDWYGIYMYKYAGVDQESGLPLYWHRVTYDDVNEKTNGTYANYGKYKDYKIGDNVKTNNSSEASLYECGSAIPAWIGGLTTNLRYKDFDLGVVLAYQLGGKFFSTEYANGLFNESTYLNAAAESPSTYLIGNTWTPENTSAKYPIQMYGTSYYSGSTIGSWKYTDMSLFSASYMRLKNVTIGYNLPRRFSRKAGVGNLRVYASADNLFLLAAAKGIDPSMDITGGFSVRQYVYPTMRSVSIGVNLDF